MLFLATDESNYSDSFSIISQFLDKEDIPDLRDLYFELGTHAKIIEVLKTSKDNENLAFTYFIMRSLIENSSDKTVEVRLEACIRMF